MRETFEREEGKGKIRKAAGAVIGALVLGGIIFFFLYFKVDTVEVLGSGRYSQEEIQEMILKGPLAGNSVLAPLMYSKDQVEDVPFVEGFSVSQVDRNTICISVKEKEPVGCIRFLDCYIYFDREGKVIETAVERELKVPFFDGLQMNHVAMNEKLPIESDTLLNTAVTLSQIFEKNDSIPDHIIFDEQSAITLEYGEITVQLGKDEYLEDKMSRLIAILPMIQGQKGILHLEGIDENTKTITFEKELTEEEKKAQEEQENSEDGEPQEGDSQGEQEETDTYYEDSYSQEEMTDDSQEDTWNSEESWDDSGSEDTYQDQTYDSSDQEGDTWSDETDTEQTEYDGSYQDESVDYVENY